MQFVPVSPAAKGSAKARPVDLRWSFDCSGLAARGRGRMPAGILASRLHRLERRQQWLPAGHEMADRWGRDRGHSGVFNQRQVRGGTGL